MHHTQLPDTTLSDKVCSARPLAGSSSVAPVFVADLSLLDSCNCSTITNDSHGDLRFQSFDFMSHFLSNQQFSVTAVTTSTGSVAERYAYTAYGQPTFLDASGAPLTTQTSTLNARYLYTGREWDATLGLYHFRARWMSGVAGRFLGRDPTSYRGQDWNLMLMLEDNGLTGTDPQGLFSIQKQGKKPPQWPEWNKKWRDICKGKPDSKFEHPKEWGSWGTRSDCEKAMASIPSGTGEWCSKLRIIESQFNGKPCRLPRVQCDCCDFGMQYRADKDPTVGTVRVCWNTIIFYENNNAEYLCRKKYHELIHAKQYCFGLNPEKSCEGSILRELEAYYCEKQCHDFESCIGQSRKSFCGWCPSQEDIDKVDYEYLRLWFDRIKGMFVCAKHRDGW